MFMNIKELEARQLADMLAANTDVQVVDIRQPAEVHSGTVPGAEMIPMHTIPLRIEDIKQDKPVVLVCRSGARSAQACSFLAQNGFENIFNLRGGMMGWAQSGLEIGLPQAV
ncbi:MAG: rhodanese-like domain-containing protein [Gammaproteobacteria bacterium]|nr:rhodanese-like domain-containing protein [Gammaproteobacteria bacterium]MDH5777852.1 rhodanese-like domain-containing protein [Gammaproteobacteria bacterium]